MAEQATLVGMNFPAPGRVSIKIEINVDINVSAYVARQKANRFFWFCRILWF